MKPAWSFFRHQAKQRHPWPSLPRFAIGQLVYQDFLVNDDDHQKNGQSFRDYGQVIGVIWNPNWWNVGAGWVYIVKWVECNSYPHDTGLTDEIEESRLHPAHFRRFTRWAT